MEQKKAQNQQAQQNDQLKNTNPTDRDFQRTEDQHADEQNSGEDAGTTGEDTEAPKEGSTEGSGNSSQGDTKNVSE
jgi:hypothetical protein